MLVDDRCVPQRMTVQVCEGEVDDDVGVKPTLGARIEIHFGSTMTLVGRGGAGVEGEAKDAELAACEGAPHAHVVAEGYAWLQHYHSLSKTAGTGRKVDVSGH